MTEGYVERAYRIAHLLMKHGDMSAQEAMETVVRHGDALTPREVELLKQRMKEKP